MVTKLELERGDILEACLAEDLRLCLFQVSSDGVALLALKADEGVYVSTIRHG